VPLGLRGWGAVAVAEHAGLRERLLSRSSETSRQGCEWRYAVLQARPWPCVHCLRSACFWLRSSEPLCD